MSFSPNRAGAVATGLSAVFLGSLASAAATGTEQVVYRDPKAPIEQRVEDLLSRMTLEEKVAQIGGVWVNKSKIIDAQGRFSPAKASEFIPHGTGQIGRPMDAMGLGDRAVVPGRSVRNTVEFVNAAQKWATGSTRLGIPILFHAEALHGYMAPSGTHFPQAIALASTWDPELIERMFSVVAREVRASGIHLVLAPVIDVGREPRWGRIEETYGEDPFLVGEIGVAAIRGFQGDQIPLAPGKVFATLKHMTGHGQPESGTNVGPAVLTERVLRDVFLWPFEQAVKRTKVKAIMPSYNEIDGVPSHANRWMLTDVLRGEWGFDGVVVSDYDAINQLSSLHFVAASKAEAARIALGAGVDWELPDTDTFAYVADLVREGKIPQAQVDNAVRRALRTKFEAGLFENPYADARAAERLIGNAEARALAAEVARRAVVLLKNEGGLLPLDRTRIKRLAVIGPNSDEAILGGYSDKPAQTVSVLEGIRAKVGKDIEVLHAKGVRITESRNEQLDPVNLADPQENRRLIQEAVEVARGADAIVLCIGDNEHTSREAWSLEHLGDRANIDLVGQQQDLADALLALGKPLVVVLINAKPLAITRLAETAPAILEAWYPGQEGGTALADILFGDANPGGKLPITFARSVGHLPVFYNRKPSARRGYLFDSVEPLFPFGYGLSYTRFELGPPKLSAANIKAGDPVTVSVEVRNAGDRAGDEVVQVYVQDVVSSITRPLKELKGFKRVTLAPGERREVQIPLSAEAFAYTGPDMKRVIEPGLFRIMVGANSRDLQTVELTVHAR
jgi:beta-glucosidase